MTKKIQHKMLFLDASFGHNRPGGDANALLYLDAPFSEKVLAEIRANPAIELAKRLQFDVEGV